MVEALDWAGRILMGFLRSEAFSSLARAVLRAAAAAVVREIRNRTGKSRRVSPRTERA